MIIYFSSYLQGMYAFGLVETGFYKEAESHALKVLENFTTRLFPISFVVGPFPSCFKA